MPVLTRVRDAAAATGGVALGAVFRAAGTLRPALKPLHPRGRLRRGRLHRLGLDPGVGVPFLDEAGTDEVVVRLSRAIGLPDRLPDIHGLALRVPVGDGHGDLLFASTGWGRVGRFVLTAGRRPGDRPLTSLLPYRTPAGPVVLGARVSGDVVTLACAVGTGPFRTFGELVLAGEHGDPAVAFDPVRNQVPGLAVPPWVQRLREPAYAGARRSREVATDPSAGE